MLALTLCSRKHTYSLPAFLSEIEGMKLFHNDTLFVAKNIQLELIFLEFPLAVIQIYHKRAADKQVNVAINRPMFGQVNAKLKIPPVTGSRYL